jgi:acyl-CoA reductase-like NAD-dependent aldehyde dehydrogenase
MPSETPRTEVPSYRMYIGGKWVGSGSKETLDVVNPATEQVIANVPKATRDEVKQALESAEKAQPAWEDLSPLQRSKYLLKTAELIQRDRERLAALLTAEEGKPLFESRLEVDGSAENFRYYAEFARRLEGDVLPSDNPRQTVMILRLPIGVVASITPWNFPSATVARKLAPALITGNAVVTKPSSNTPLSSIELVKLAEEAGLPKGVLNLVTGSGSKVGDELVSNPKTGLVTMTGSTEAGKRIMASASGHVSKLILELGGKAPFIVWGDADMEWALKCAIWARFWNCGQTCICSERMYVDEKVKDRFVPAFVKLAKELRIGDPNSPETDLGPMVSRQGREAAQRFVGMAEEEGSKILLGGSAPQGKTKGWYFEPTVVEESDQKSALVQDEIFGPLVPVLEVDDFDRAIEYANDSQYGLASYVFTKDYTKVLKAMNKIKFGESYINQVGPEQLQGAHTGFRMTGVGAEGSRYGLECYTQLKTCYLDWNDKPGLQYLFPYGHGPK